MTTQRRYSIEFKRQVVQEYQAGETLHGLAKRHGISRNLIRIWAAKAEAASSTTTSRQRAFCRSTKRASVRWNGLSASWRSRTSF
jgi:transposase-like protein